MQTEAVPPNNQNAERAVLGALMHPDGGDEAIQTVLRIGLKAAHFYNKNTHQKTYRAILKLHNQGTPIDLQTVTAATQFDVETVKQLDEMIESVPTTQNVGHYAAIVMEMAERRLYIQQGGRADDLAVEIKELRANYDKILQARPLDPTVMERPKPEDAESFIAQDHPPVPMLIGGGLVPACGYTMLGGYAKSGKTTLALQMSICLESGTPFLGRFPIEKQGARVLYCYFENHPSGMADILKKQKAGWGAGIDLSNLILQDAQGVCLELREDRRWLTDILTEQKIDLCVIDPVSLARRREQNAYEVVREFLLTIKSMGLETNTAFLLIHHLKKPGSVKLTPFQALSGSMAWINMAESMIALGLWDETTPPSYCRLEAQPRYEPVPEEVCLYRNNANLFEVFADPERIPKVRTENVVELVKDLGPIGYSALATVIVEAENIGIATAKRKIAQAVSDKLIIKGADKKYVIALASGK